MWVKPRSDLAPLVSQLGPGPFRVDQAWGPTKADLALGSVASRITLRDRAGRLWTREGWLAHGEVEGDRVAFPADWFEPTEPPEGEPIPKYEPCPQCGPARAAGRYDAAIGCRTCDGKGIRRNGASYRCNQCAGPLCPDVPDGNPNGSIPHGLVEKEVSGGYESVHLSDCTGYKFSLCEKCLRTMFDTFKIPPETKHYSIGVLGDTGEASPYEVDADWYRFRLWRDAGGPRKKLETGICNGREHCPNPAKWRHFLSDRMTDEAWCDDHKRGFANSCFVPVEAVAGIPLDREQRTKEQQIQAADALLRVRVLDRTHITWFNYLCGEMLDVVGEKRNAENEIEVGGLFVPLFQDPLFQGLETLREIDELYNVQFSWGRLCWAPRSIIKQIRKSAIRDLIIEAQILPGLPEEEGAAEDEPPPEILGTPRSVVQDMLTTMRVRMRSEEDK